MQISVINGYEKYQHGSCQGLINSHYAFNQWKSSDNFGFKDYYEYVWLGCRNFHSIYWKIEKNKIVKISQFRHTKQVAMVNNIIEAGIDLTVYYWEWSVFWSGRNFNHKPTIPCSTVWGMVLQLWYHIVLYIMIPDTMIALVSKRRS